MRSDVEKQFMEAVKDDNNIEILQALISSAKININFVDEHGYTPLICAAEFGCLNVVRFLLKHGAKANFFCEGRNFIGHTPLMAATIEGYIEIIKELLDAGADPNFCPKNSDPP